MATIEKALQIAARAHEGQLHEHGQRSALIRRASG
jgi:hypothetical protein